MPPPAPRPRPVRRRRIAWQALDAALGPLLRSLRSKIQRRCAFHEEVGLGRIVERHFERLVYQLLAGYFYRAALAGDDVFCVLRIPREELSDEFLFLRRNDHDRDAVGLGALILAGQDRPVRLDAGDLEFILARQTGHRGSIFRPGKHGERPLGAGHLYDYVATENRYVTLNLGPEIVHRTDNERDDAGVDHPDACVDQPQRNPANRRGNKRGGQQPDQQVKRPPMEPLELGHLEEPMLPERRIGAAD